MRALVVQTRPVTASVVDAPDEAEARGNWLREAVGGWVEGIGTNKPDQFGAWFAYLNEEGKVHGLPLNEGATMLAQRAGRNLYGDVLLGTVVFLGVGKGGDDADVPDAILNLAIHLGILKGIPS